jgi:hypothetical protein
MNHAFVRSEPSKGWIIREFARDTTKVRHKFFNGHTGQRLGKHLNGLAHEFVAIAERERDSGSSKAILTRK